MQSRSMHCQHPQSTCTQTHMNRSPWYTAETHDHRHLSLALTKKEKHTRDKTSDTLSPMGILLHDLDSSLFTLISFALTHRWEYANESRTPGSHSAGKCWVTREYHPLQENSCQHKSWIAYALVLCMCVHFKRTVVQREPEQWDVFSGWSRKV